MASDLSNLDADLKADLEAVEETKVSFGRRTHREDAEMDITPMIDITFLLLIFFLVASKMEPSAAIDLPPARHGQAVPAKESIILTIAEGTGDTAAVYLGNSTAAADLIETADLKEQEQIIIDYIKMGIAGSPPFDSPKQYVMIKAAKGIKHREVSRVIKAVGAAGEVSSVFVAILED